MKKTLIILSICVLIICSIALISNINLKTVYGQVGEINPIVTKIILTSNKTEITNNGTDTVTLTAVAEDERGNIIQNINIEYYQGTKKLSSNTFTTTTIGTYSLTAKINRIISNPIIIKVNTPIAATLTLTSNKTEITNNGTDTVTLTAVVKNDAGETISNTGVEYYQGTKKLSSNTFTTTTIGTYSLTAKIDNLTSNAISIRVQTNTSATTWNKTKTKYINSANKLLESANKIKTQISSSTISTDSKNLIIQKIELEKTAITTFKTNLASELAPNDLKTRTNQLSNSIKAFKANLNIFSKKLSYLKAEGKLSAYCVKMKDVASTSTMPTEIKTTMINKYQTKITEIQTYSNTLINGEVNATYITNFKNQLKTKKQEIKTIDTELKLRISAAIFQYTLTSATTIFNSLTNCTNTSLKSKINTSLTAKPAQLASLNLLINDPSKFKDAKKEGNKIKSSLQSDIKNIKKLASTCSAN